MDSKLFSSNTSLLLLEKYGLADLKNKVNAFLTEFEGTIKTAPVPAKREVAQVLKLKRTEANVGDFTIIINGYDPDEDRGKRFTAISIKDNKKDIQLDFLYDFDFKSDLFTATLPNYGFGVVEFSSGSLSQERGMADMKFEALNVVRGRTGDTFKCVSISGKFRNGVSSRIETPIMKVSEFNPSEEQK